MGLTTLKTLTVERVGCHLCSRNSLEEYLPNYSRHAVSDGDHGMAITREPATFEIGENGWNLTLAGFKPVITYMAQAAGVEVEVRDRNPVEIDVDDNALNSSGSEVDVGLLEFAKSRQEGLIKIGQSVEPARIIAQIANLFPDAKIVIMAKRKNDARSVARSLRDSIPDVIGVTTERDPNCRPKVIAATFCAALANTCVRLHERDIVFALDAVEAMHRDAVTALNVADFAKHFAFQRLDESLALQDEDRIRGFFGFHEVIIPHHGQKMKPVDVVWLPIKGGPQVSNGDHFDIKYAGIARNRLRNRRIAKFARWLVSGATATGSEDFRVALDAVDIPGPKTAILVDSVTHALTLAGRLEDWPIVLGHDFNAEAVPEELRQKLNRSIGMPVVGDRQIITTMAAKDLDLSQLDIVIRADGGVGFPRCLQNLVTSSNDRSRLLLIDFNDRHHPMLRKNQRRRRIAYTAAGWYAPGADPVEERVKQYIAKRQEQAA